MINKEKAINAFRGTSHTPEKRAEAFIKEFDQLLGHAVEDIKERAYSGLWTARQEQIFESCFEKFKQKAVEKAHAYLDHRANIVSMLVAGPDGMPKGQEKRMKKEQELGDKYISYLEMNGPSWVAEEIWEEANTEMLNQKKKEQSKKKLNELRKEAAEIVGAMYQGYDKSLMKNSLYNTLAKAKREGFSEEVNTVLQEIANSNHNPFSYRHKIWKLTTN